MTRKYGKGLHHKIRRKKPMKFNEYRELTLMADSRKKESDIKTNYRSYKRNFYHPTTRLKKIILRRKRKI